MGQCGDGRRAGPPRRPPPFPLSPAAVPWYLDLPQPPGPFGEQGLGWSWLLTTQGAPFLLPRAVRVHRWGRWVGNRPSLPVIPPPAPPPPFLSHTNPQRWAGFVGVGALATAPTSETVCLFLGPLSKTPMK